MMANVECCTQVKLAASLPPLERAPRLPHPQELEQVILICRRVK